MWKYYAIRLAAILIAPLPARLGHLIANFFGEFGYFFGRKARANAEEKVRHILGRDVDDKTVRRITRETFRNLSRNYYDLIRVPHLSPEEMERRVEFVGVEHMERAWEAGRGAIAATIHMANFDLVAQATMMRSFPLTILVERFQPDKLWEYFMKLRAARGAIFQPAGGRGLRAAYRALRRGEVVGIACDRAVLGEGITTTFLGEPAAMPVGAAKLALRTGAALLPVFCTRTGRDRYRVTVEPPIPVSSNGHGRHTAEDVRLVVDEVIVVMERYIRRTPGQWMLFQPLWPGGDGA